MVMSYLPHIQNTRVHSIIDASDLAIGYLRGSYTQDSVSESITYNIFEGSMTYNIHPKDGTVSHDDGKVVSVIDFKNKYIVLSTTSNAAACSVSWIRMDAPGPLGSSDGRSAHFSMLPVTLEGQAAGLDKIGPRDFALKDISE